MIGVYENTRDRDSHMYAAIELSEIECKNGEGQKTNDTVAGTLTRKTCVNKIYMGILFTVIVLFLSTLTVLVYFLVSSKPCVRAFLELNIVNGTWADWSTWGSCSEDCGGMRTRLRTCTDPPPFNGGSFCSGNSSEKGPCYEHSCFLANSNTWGSWMILGSCSDTCTRTRRRSCTVPLPSYGETSCSSNYTESRSCYEQNCFLENNYYISTKRETWNMANSECKVMNASLVMLESEAEIDFLDTMINGAFHHWIGMTCNNGTHCTWIDGRSVEDGFQAWAPGEPSNYDCVWIGYLGNNWDDYLCSTRMRYICELP